MAKSNKKMAAAMAAVNAFLQEEEREAQTRGFEENQPQPRILFWAQAGRQDMMTMRRMVQMRAFSRLN